MDDGTDAGAESEAEGEGEAESEAEGECDADSDGFLAISCGGDDCDDQTDEIRPDVIEIEEWDFVVVNGPSEFVHFIHSLATDADGVPYLAYHTTTELLRTATNPSLGWLRETVPTDAYDFAGDYNSLRLDASGGRHLAFITSGETPVYATDVSGTWVLEPVGETEIFDHVCLALDGATNAHIVYWEEGPVYATNVSGKWERQKIAERGVPTSNQCVDAAGGMLHATLIDSSNNAVLHATKSVTPVSSDWLIETVVEDNNVANAVIVVTGDGARVAYASDAGISVGVLATDWTTDVIDDTGLGVRPSLTADADDNLYVAFYVRETDEVRYAYQDSGAWVSDAAADGVVTERNVSITASGKLVQIAYEDDLLQDLFWSRLSVPDGIDNDCDGDTL